MNLWDVIKSWFTQENPVSFPTDPNKYSQCVATIFALNYNGSNDKGDNGAGAFHDPKTNLPYRTRYVVGVSVPIPLYHAMPITRAGIESGRFVVDMYNVAKPQGIEYGILIVDLGPGEHDELIEARWDGKEVGHFLDRTYPLCKQMGDMNDILVRFAIRDTSTNTYLAIKGLDGPIKRLD
jgi:hypothetical protein